MNLPDMVSELILPGKWTAPESLTAIASMDLTPKYGTTRNGMGSFVMSLQFSPAAKALVEAREVAALEDIVATLFLTHIADGMKPKGVCTGFLASSIDRHS
ncbi:hypothetical protein NX059_002324 [Plenodomus lindquistii]|nr:hypothetical protein NX059_002324 [Plenodomus lindquistii]